MKIFYIVRNGGDGSSSVDFCDSKECIDYLLSDDYPYPEDYQDGDGGSWGSFEAPGGIEFEGSWKKVKTLEDLRKAD